MILFASLVILAVWVGTQVRRVHEDRVNARVAQAEYDQRMSALPFPVH